MGEEQKIGPIEEFDEINVDKQEPSKTLRVGKLLRLEIWMKLEEFLKIYLDIFSWNHGYMMGIDPKMACHKLNIQPSIKLVRQ